MTILMLEALLHSSTDNSDYEMSSAFPVHSGTGNHLLNLSEKWPDHHQHRQPPSNEVIDHEDFSNT